jgi:hypothetical protein
MHQQLFYMQHKTTTTSTRRSTAAVKVKLRKVGLPAAF